MSEIQDLVKVYVIEYGNGNAVSCTGSAMVSSGTISVDGVVYNPTRAVGVSVDYIYLPTYITYYGQGAAGFNEYVIVAVEGYIKKEKIDNYIKLI